MSYMKFLKNMDLVSVLIKYWIDLFRLLTSNHCSAINPKVMSKNAVKYNAKSKKWPLDYLTQLTFCWWHELFPKIWLLRWDCGRSDALRKKCILSLCWLVTSVDFHCHTNKSHFQSALIRWVMSKFSDERGNFSLWFFFLYEWHSLLSWN